MRNALPEATRPIAARRQNRDREGAIFSPSGANTPSDRRERTGASVPSDAYLHRGTGLEFEMEAAWVRKHLSTATRTIVDVGCGNGELLASLPSANVIGFDYSFPGLVHARDRNADANVACARADRLPLPNESIDAVVAQHVIEHMPDVDAAIREWRRVLRPHGVLLLLTPNASFADPSIFDDPTHVRLFRARDLRDVVVRAGLFVSELRTLGLPWFRDYKEYVGGWRLRRFVTTHADSLSAAPLCRWRGQTLCCAAPRSDL